MKFSIKDFCSKCDQIRSFLGIWSHLLEKSLMENFIFFTVVMGRSWLHFITNFGLNEVLTNHDLNPQTTPSSTNQSIDLHCKSVSWFLYDGEHWSLIS